MAAPRTADVLAVLRRSQRRWESDLNCAESLQEFTDNITNPKTLLHRVPVMPSNPKLEQFPNGTLLEVRGQATWQYGANGKCDLSESVVTKELTIGVTVVQNSLPQVVISVTGKIHIALGMTVIR